MSTTSETATGPPNYMDSFYNDTFDDIGTAEFYSMLSDDQQLDAAFGGIDDLQLTTNAYLSSLTDSGSSSTDSAIFSTNSDATGSPSPSVATSSGTQPPGSPGAATAPPIDGPPPPSPVVIDPNEIDKISVTLEKNQQCRCKSCNKLFNSVWYLKQHAVKHSNDRPFKCKFCLKTYKFRSNLYQHKCPERNRQLGGPNGIRKRFYTRGIAYTEVPKLDGDSESTKTETNDEIPDNQGAVNRSNTENQQPVNADFNNYDQSYNKPTAPPPPPEPLPQFELIPVEAPPLPLPEGTTVTPKVEIPPLVPNSIRLKQLDPAFIEDYLERKKHKLHTCRKCRFQFPSRAHLKSHMTAHNLADAFCFCCPQCPQKFTTEQRLLKHLELHATNQSPVPHFCRQCNGAFRSHLALRRHVDQSRICYSYPFGIKPKLLYDPYSFIESDDEGDQTSDSGSVKELVGGVTHHKSTTDSGVGSDTSSHTTSPRQSFNLLEDDFDEKCGEDTVESEDQPRRKRTKKTSENSSEDADSGFRSRLNSQTSCSPTSSHFSTGSASPGSSGTANNQSVSSATHVDYNMMPGPSGLGNSCFSGSSFSDSGTTAMPSMSYAEIDASDVHGVSFEPAFQEFSSDDGSTLTARRGKMLQKAMLTMLKPTSIKKLPCLPIAEETQTSNSTSGSGKAPPMPILTAPNCIEMPSLKALIAIFLDTLIKLSKESVAATKKPC